MPARAPPTLELLSQRGLVTKGKAEVIKIIILKSVGREEVIILPNYSQLTILNTRGGHSAGSPIRAIKRPDLKFNISGSGLDRGAGLYGN